MPSTPPVVLITGANQGIGYYIAELLSQSNNLYTILVGSRNMARGEDAVAKLLKTKTNHNTTITTIQIDITSPSSIAAAVEKITNKYGRLDILINNAAVPSSEQGKIATTIADWETVFSTNVIGTVATTHSFLPLLSLSLDAKIVVLSSSIGSITMAEASPPHPLSPTASPYRASKAAMNMVIVEWNKLLKGIKVWGVDPGLCATDFAGEYSRSRGRDPREGADVVRQCVEREREDCVGKVVWEQNGESGVRPW
ncbi:NAD(P)-binding protein [Zopfia rhizophila CBS 207.26]|uniref:NAD(P)-binding protein n=1 Tax=Zopfia rhizophila CBS 207.26 TaxID=1314779 RepID=A0A6A6ER65_9PEZI|nr:NAD(P)-binding protein [Zopfia rhizophila CBS 207.26]